MRQPPAPFGFPVPPLYVSMVWTQNRTASNPLELFAGCTQVVAVCRRKKLSTARFPRQGCKREMYECADHGCYVWVAGRAQSSCRIFHRLPYLCVWHGGWRVSGPFRQIQGKGPYASAINNAHHQKTSKRERSELKTYHDCQCSCAGQYSLSI